jgi:16S rRNA (uracil1498-N3)-methyltransferase
VLHEDATAPLADVRVPAAGSGVVVVGPEGGRSEEEVARYEAAGAHAVRLGSEVLRTSTAGVAAASALLSRTSRWGG